MCRRRAGPGAGLVTLAVPESLQPLFAAKVVEATTMPLAEDDVEEVDPEPALARILDHDHDALVLGPGLRPSLATAELVRGHPRRPGARPPCPAVVDAEALRTLAAEDGWWEGVVRPVGPDAPLPGSSPGCGRRAASPRLPTGISWVTTTPGLPRPQTRPEPGARSSSSRVPGR